MKLRTESGRWILTDGEREIDFNGNGLVAWGYAFAIKDIREFPKAPRRSYTVRSLTPNPKKRRFPKKWREKIKKIKANYEAGIHENESYITKRQTEQN
jgi:hypothetical protein